MSNTPSSQTKSDKSKVSLLNMIATIFTIIGTLSQIIGVGFKILDYFQQAPPNCIELVEKTITTNTDKADPQVIDN